MLDRKLTGLLAKLGQGVRAGYDLARVGAGLGRGPNQKKTLNAAAWSQTWPAPGATLDLDFANDRGFVRGVGQGRSMDAVTFTRASNGNWVDSAGVLRTGAGTFPGTANALGVNLLTFPQDFDNAAWTTFGGVSIAQNTDIAPDGTATADVLNITANTPTLFQSVAVTAGSTYTFSFYAKAGTAADAKYSVFNQTAGADIVAATSYASLINTATWSRVSVTFVAPIGCTAVRVYIARDNFALGTLVLWGAQLELGSSATTYYPTNINVPRFDWASTAVVAQKNLLTYTQEFDNAAWTKTNSTVSANSTTAPDGTTTADSLFETAVNFTHRITSPTVTKDASAAVYTAQIFFKPNGRNRIALQLQGDVNNGVYCIVEGSGSGTVVVGATAFGSGWGAGTATISASTNGFYSVVLSSTSNTLTTIYSQVFLVLDGTTTTSYLGDITKGVYLWGAQLETGSSATAYQAVSYPTTNTPLLPASTCNGLLIEESRANRILWCRDGLNGGAAVGTNLLTYSEQFNNGAWLKVSANISQDATTAPDGTTTADAIVEVAATNTHNVAQPYTTITGANYIFSCYVKQNGRTWCALSLPIANGGAWFDIANGVVGTKQSGVVTSAIADAGNGWWRCTIVGVGTGASSLNAAVYAANADNSVSYAGDITKGIYVWGAQLFPGNILTNYQVTVAATVIGWARASVTVAKDQTGIDGVANATTSITATAANGTLIQPISLASGSRTASVYLKRITGTGNVQVSLDGSTWSTVDLSSTEWRRIVLSGTVTNPVVGIRLAANGDAVAMDYAQVEDGTFATTPILTTTASATRSNDAASMQGATFVPWFSSNNGTFYCDFKTNFTIDASVSRSILTLDQSIAKRLAYINSNTSNLLNNDGAVGSTIAVTNGANTKITTGYKGSEKTLSANAGQQFSTGTNPAYSLASQLEIGSRAFTNNLCGTIKRVSFFPIGTSSAAASNLTGS